ncbi:hypothetical protein BCV70DRAFT_230974 [Testicularia cyperi]|uniref:Uncharacterized protein n=1 Tax=Testicularia cyperi TaxID=1882483 RepID=A0A317XRI3_9BASI|nr:hypothetical protein BCV70DRAFT_230974 [Testicularia cyperi]
MLAVLPDVLGFVAFAEQCRSNWFALQLLGWELPYLFDNNDDGDGVSRLIVRVPIKSLKTRIRQVFLNGVGQVSVKKMGRETILEIGTEGQVNGWFLVSTSTAMTTRSVIKTVKIKTAIPATKKLSEPCRHGSHS